MRESPPKACLGEGFLADAFDGGTGVCEVSLFDIHVIVSHRRILRVCVQAIFENFEEFWQKAADMSRGCRDCGGYKGCPSCL